MTCNASLSLESPKNSKINFRNAQMLGSSDVFVAKRMIYVQDKYDTIKH